MQYVYIQVHSETLNEHHLHVECSNDFFPPPFIPESVKPFRAFEYLV